MNQFFRDGGFLFDSHCHLNHPKFEKDRGGVVAQAVKAGVEKILDVGDSLETSKQAINNAKKYTDTVFVSVGIDAHAFIPHLTQDFEHFDDELLKPGAISRAQDQLLELVKENKDFVVALGETGLDNYWLPKIVQANKITEDGADELFSAQKELFRAHLELGVETGLPLTVHSRAAESETLKIVETYPAARGVFHSYAGNYQTAKSVLDSGWQLGVNGIVTFPNATDLVSVYKKILGKVSTDWSPSDFYKRGIFFETDAPFLAPQGNRGERNEPKNVKSIYEQFMSLLLS